MRFPVLCVALLVVACGKKEEAPPAVVTLKFADPGPGVSVKKAKEMGSGEEVVVEGRVSNIVKGVAAYNLVDDELYYCGRGGAEDECKTPWDYCCVDAGERAAATLSVEHRGPDGKRLPTIRLLDLVAVKGKIEKDEHGNVTIVETARFVRERPKLPDDLHWPE
jgi:hypothetical protein